MSKVKSKRNKNVIAVDGFMYIHDKSNTDKTKKYWRCRRKDLNCPARIHTGYDDFTVLKKSTKNHCHNSEMARIEVDAALTELRERAISSNEPMSSLINECVNSLSDAAKSVLKSSTALKKQVRRIRNNEKVVSQQDPMELVSLQIPDNSDEDNHENYSSFRDKEKFLRVHNLASKWTSSKDNMCILPTTSSIKSDLIHEIVEKTQLSDDVILNDKIKIENDIENTLVPPPNQIKKETNLETKIDLLLDSIKQSCTEQIQRINRDTDDEDLNFYKSTLPMVKTLNRDQKIKFRVAILKLLQSTSTKDNQ
ncbi:BESS motif,Zinc finger, FLYWCH-type [Cinara cedri]|uniref:BESS motif,Zinc finger, FLYWCH-type n=1 Tax=Cinara cedri TaxID=506608 RepID=A0A5E4NDH0_9HEMI|nr:BESS motif,Zinc finger, FLYWCH-type [Cinara cedri]